MGSATLVFAVLYSVVLRPLPYRDPNRLAFVCLVYGVSTYDPITLAGAAGILAAAGVAACASPAIAAARTDPAVLLRES